MSSLVGRLNRACTNSWVPDHLRHEGAFEEALASLWFDIHVHDDQVLDFFRGLVGDQQLVLGTNFAGWDQHDLSSGFARISGQSWQTTPSACCARHEYGSNSGQQREIGERWPLILATCVGIVSSSFVLPYHTIGALLTPVTEEFGWSRAQFQAAILFSSGLGALTAPIIGWFNDRYGPRRVALPSMVGLSLGFLIASQMAGELWMLFAAYGFMALLGAGTIPVTWTRAIATSFFKRRGLALGLALTGTGLCASVAPHYIWLTGEFGWRGAYLGLALVPLVLAFPVLFFFFRPLSEASQEALLAENASHQNHGVTLGEALRGYRFWILLLSILFAYQGFSGIGPNLLPSMTDDGFSREQAASVQSVFGLSIIIGRVVVGYLVDRFWAPGVAGICLAVPAIGVFLLHGEQSWRWRYWPAS